MSRITALQLSDKRRRVNVFVDNSYSFDVDKDVVIGAGLKVGQSLSDDQIVAITQADIFHSCFEIALHYLGYRLRSEAEVRRRLHRGGFGDDVVSKVLAELKKRKLVDDVAFAHFWKDNRQSFRPRSRRFIELELRQKGISNETAGEVVENLDDKVSAYKVGLGKSRHLSVSDYGEFRRRLFGYLRRRGFDYEVINQTVTRLWQEQQPTSV